MGGKKGGPTPGFTAPPKDKSKQCSRRSGLTCCRCPSSRFATTSLESGWSTWTATLKWRRHTTRYLLDTSANDCRSNGTSSICEFSIPRLGSFFESTSNKSLGIAGRYEQTCHPECP